MSLPVVDLSLKPAPAPLQRSQQVTRSPDRYEYRHISLSATLSGTSIPTCYSQAVKDAHWVTKVNDELYAFQEKFIWEIVP